jgi:hypothetical protein
MMASCVIGADGQLVELSIESYVSTCEGERNDVLGQCEANQRPVSAQTSPERWPTGSPPHSESI